MPRHVFPSSATHADMLAWCRIRLAEPMKVPEPLPTQRRPRAEPEPPLPLLFENLPEQRRPERPDVVPVTGAEPPLVPVRWSAEQLGVIEDYAVLGVSSTAWKAYVIPTAKVSSEQVEVAGKGCSARVLITETRLGWTSGFDLQAFRYGAGEGGNWHPNADAHGFYLWATRQAALHHGACELWQASRDGDTADRIRSHFAMRGYDVMEPPGDEWKRRLVSHEDARRLRLVAHRLRTHPVGRMSPEIRDAVAFYERAFEQAAGLDDHDAFTDGQAPAPPARPLDEMLLDHFRGVISPPSALAMKRRARRRERENIDQANRINGQV